MSMSYFSVDINYIRFGFKFIVIFCLCHYFCFMYFLYLITSHTIIIKTPYKKLKLNKV